MLTIRKKENSAYGMLQEAYGDKMISIVVFYRWFKWLSDGQEHIEDELRPSCLKIRPNGEKHRGLAKVGNGIPSINCRDDI